MLQTALVEPSIFHHSWASFVCHVILLANMIEITVHSVQMWTVLTEHTSIVLVKHSFALPFNLFAFICFLSTILTLLIRLHRLVYFSHKISWHNTYFTVHSSKYIGYIESICICQPLNDWHNKTYCFFLCVFVAHKWQITNTNRDKTEMKWFEEKNFANLIKLYHTRLNHRWMQL